MGSYIDASEIEFDQAGPFDYPSPSASSEAQIFSEEPSKKKRKAWGQPVPEIVPILPPRKRAKTTEEKEQRKNERILRNRRAADKSRQRQKAAQAGLEQQNKDLASENARLKELLRVHGITQDYTFTPPPSTPSIDFSYQQLEQHDAPPFSPITPRPIDEHDSPVIGPELDLNQVTMDSTPSVQDSGLTQYPAVVLCDLQCQPVLNKKLRALQPTSLVNTVVTLLHYLTIAMNCSTSMHSRASNLFRTLQQALLQTSPQLESIVLNNFQLIHILISMPSTSTQPAVFRMKLLSRLLACNPSLAPLLTMAADRALQQNLSQGDCMGDADSRWRFSSLMTLKWSIQWLAKEHFQIRVALRSGRLDRDSLYEKAQKGVECDVVEKHYKLFDQVDPEPWLRVVSHSLPSATTQTEVS